MRNFKEALVFSIVVIVALLSLQVGVVQAAGEYDGYSQPVEVFTFDGDSYKVYDLIVYDSRGDMGFFQGKWKNSLIKIDLDDVAAWEFLNVVKKKGYRKGSVIQFSITMKSGKKATITGMNYSIRGRTDLGSWKSTLGETKKIVFSKNAQGS